MTLVSSVLIFAGCGKPAGTPAATDLQFASELLASQMFEDARLHFAALAADVDALDPQRPLVIYGLALSLWKSSRPGIADYDRALLLFEELAAADLRQPLAAAAQLNLARMQMLYSLEPEEPRLEDAIVLLRELVDKSRGDVRHEAVVRLAEAYRMRYTDPASAAVAKNLLRDWLRFYPHNPYAALMWEQLAYLHLYYGEEWTAALEAFLQGAAIGFDGVENVDAVYWVAGQLAQDMGRNREAVQLLGQLVGRFPFSGYAAESRQIIAELMAAETAHGQEALVRSETSTEDFR